MAEKIARKEVLKVRMHVTFNDGRGAMEPEQAC